MSKRKSRRTVHENAERCGGTYCNGRARRFVRCEGCGYVDYEANEGDRCQQFLRPEQRAPLLGTQLTDTPHLQQRCGLCHIAPDMLGVCRILLGAYSESETLTCCMVWEDVYWAFRLAETTLAKVNNSATLKFYVLLQDPRDANSDTPLFSGLDGKWVPLHEAAVIAKSDETDINERLWFGRDPIESWRLIELPKTRRIFELR